MSAEDVKRALLEAVRSPTSIVILTPDYVWALWEESPGTWKQAWWSFADKEGGVETLDVRKALLYLMEEVKSSLVNYSKGGFKVILAQHELEEILSKIG